MINHNTILAVDDEPDILGLIKYTLMDEGYNVEIAESGEDALILLEKNISIDLILLDISMPGLSGIDVLEIIKNNPKTSDIPVIMVTALDQMIYKKQAYSLGANDFLAKPYEIEELLLRVSNHIHLFELMKKEKEQNIQLNSSNAELKSLISAMPIMVSVKGPDQRYLMVNSTFCEKSGKLEDEIIGHTDQELFPIEISSQYNSSEDLIVSQQKTSMNTIYKLNNEDGKETWIFNSSASIRDDAGNILKIVNTGIEITDQIIFEKKLKASEIILNSIIQGLPIPMLVIDNEHNIINWNLSLERMSGFKYEEVIGTRLQWKPFYKQERPILVDILVDGKLEKIPLLYPGKYTISNLIPDSYEVTNFFPSLGANGKWLSFTASLIRDGQNNIIGGIETLIDVTDRVKLSEELIWREAILKSVNLISALFLKQTNWIDSIDSALKYIGESIGINQITLHQITDKGSNTFNLKLIGMWKSPDLENPLEIITKFDDLIECNTSCIWKNDDTEPIFSTDFRRYLEENGVHSLIILPINVQSKRWGFLSFVDYSMNRQFSEIEINSLIIATDIIGSAIYRSELEEVFRRPIEHSLTGVFVIQNDKFKFVNPRLSEMLGYSEQELLNLSSCYSIFHPEDRKKLHDIISTILNNENSDVTLEIRSISSTNIIIIFTLFIGKVHFEQERAVICTAIDVTDRRKAEKALTISENRFKEIFNNVNDAIYLIETKNNSFGQIIDVNEKATLMLKYSKEELIGKNFVDIDANPDKEAYTQIFTRLKVVGYDTFEKEHRCRDFTLIPIEISAHLFSLNGKPVILAVSRNITERKNAENIVREIEEQNKQQIIASLKEKEILLKEIHHRVKNNLQIISSILKLQEYSSTDPEINAILRESRTRIISMAMLHEKLYRTDNLAEIPLRDYLDQLANQVVKEFESDERHATVSVACLDDYVVDIDVGIPIGLIINELVTNSMKYAFSPTIQGHIEISVTPSQDGSYTLTYHDNGKGLPSNFNIEELESLGMTLVQNLVMQNRAKLKVDGSSGATFKIIFPQGKIRTRN
ncbi:PAS domain S-box protein [Methanospirillum lacunae]|uniref:Histidine kinase n=1 Tax=Methanospirillum lacunae TaxID=668570 RepID=A0A2V2N3K9_9EURY|nr:PAS domain S-box protein [Methanospirillum lacunae]PWR69833.1 hypothetical protein DK846_16790 [Methanospirillum lacunae]